MGLHTLYHQNPKEVQNMEPRTERAAVTAAEPCGSILQEQGIELDHVLPDYYPDVCPHR